MGRARLRIGIELVSMFLKSGWRAAVPATPLRDVRVIDARFGKWTVDLLLESPDLLGSSASTLETAPEFSATFFAQGALQLPEGNAVTLQLARIADRACACAPSPDGATNRSSYQCPACLAKSALEYMPSEWISTAHDVRRELGETVPPADPGEITDEVAGA
jgi:hypothetical protein